MSERRVLDQKGPNVYGTIGKEYTPHLKTGIYHPEWHLNSDGRKKRYAEEIPGVTKKEAYVAKVVVGSKGFHYQAKRLPGYTDRVLYRDQDAADAAIVCTDHAAIGDVTTSDHKPIRAAFEI